MDQPTGDRTDRRLDQFYTPQSSGHAGAVFSDTAQG